MGTRAGGVRICLGVVIVPPDLSVLGDKTQAITWVVVGVRRPTGSPEGGCYDRVMAERALVFVSCGQVTTEEIRLGNALIALVEGTPGLQAYFAETVASLDGLTANIFRNLERASAFVTVMHHRGVVKGRPDSPDRTRASVWIEQEIAIASFLKQTRSPDLQVAAYAQRGLPGGRRVEDVVPEYRPSSLPTSPTP